MALPRELHAIIEQTHNLNTHINAFTSIVSLQQATQLYAALPRNGPLHGFSVAVKDVFCTKQLPTTAASRMLRDYTSPFDATVVQRLQSAGALIHGKTNMDEFGMGSANTHSYFGVTINPAGPRDSAERVAGGSSGGSAAAVAAGLCRVALGSDTGGSTRLPAAYCGVAGLKPSYGLLSRWGMLAYASSLDCVGIMAKTVDDVAATFDALCEHDEKDPTSAPPDARDRIATARAEQLPLTSTDLTGLRIGIPSEYFLAELSPSVLPPLRRVLASLRSKGATLQPVSLPSTPLALSAYYVLACAEASSNLARYDGTRFGMRVKDDDARNADGGRSQLYAATRSAGFGSEVQKRILLGTFALSAEAFDNYFLQAQRVRKLIRNEFDAVFRQASPLLPPSSSSSSTSRSSDDNGVDVLLHPSAISIAPLLHADPSSAYDSYTQDVMTVPASLAGLPAMSVPIGRVRANAAAEGGHEVDEGGWPVGMQISAQWGGDELVMKVGKAVEDSVNSSMKS